MKRQAIEAIQYPEGFTRNAETDFGTCNGCSQPNRVLHKHKTGEESFIWRCDDCGAER